ncbi:hypothetical protein TNCT_147571 [Trichonephila clavata]|uniref:Uncharacterized protein n=1 Tax=Trichonephila clavata TaxID=2740835 RepID=A0A8X6F841_TRICU|nr:hypothetical protein TNCT_147571 [Trichonephila clavata]
MESPPDQPPPLTYPLPRKKHLVNEWCGPQLLSRILLPPEMGTNAFWIHLKKTEITMLTTPLYAKIQREHDEISTLLENVVSDFGSILRCTTIGCPVHSSDANTPTQSPRIIQPGSPKSNTKRINDRFITPPASRYSWLHTSQP